ncbi:MAG TPA: SDR family NAD(P)-dependent oxidoreductase [Gemmatimonadales bacterium]|nr:SDR family NAD(P)-dependent oxidoreductase [Gemmatimonadales bacterium]
MAESTGSGLAVVTGASSGIGFELARQFAEHGFDLIVVAEDEGIARAADELRDLRVEVEAVQADLAGADGVDGLWERVKARGRPVAAIAINAGVGVGGPFVDNDLEEELRLVDLNVVSVVRLAKYAVRDMVSRGSGRILITSSIAAEMPAPFLAVYGASKAFVQSFAEALHYELKDTGVTVTALQPGPTDTNFFERAEMMDTKVGVEDKDDPTEVARQGFEAMMAGKHRVVAGSVRNKVQSAVAQVLPEQTKARQHAKQAEPGSAERGRKKK